MQKKSEVRFKIEQIDPKTAESYLNYNKLNRPLRKGGVEKFASDMKSGNWGLTHQAIAFDEQGNILDGQHRLWAIVESGKTIEMPVARGLDPSARDYIDQGIPRTVVDVAKLRDPDSQVTQFWGAAARRMMIGTRTHVVFTRQEVLNFLEAHEKALAFAIQDALQGKRVFRVTPAAIPAVIARASYHEDKDRIREFGSIMLGTMPKGDEDSGAHVLRGWLLAGAPNRAKAVAKDLEVYAKAQRALAGFLAGEKLRSIYAKMEEIWVLPGEPTRRAKSTPGFKATPKKK